jgi:hypothetical protein
LVGNKKGMATLTPHTWEREGGERRERGKTRCPLFGACSQQLTFLPIPVRVSVMEGRERKGWWAR